MARLTLNWPTWFRWATNASRTITPAQALLETPPVDYEDGWDFSTRCPPRLMNYIHNLQGQWDLAHRIQQLSAWTSVDRLGAATSQNVAINNNNGVWVATTAGACLYSRNGQVWAAGAAPGGTMSINCAINTDTDGLIFGDNGGGTLRYTVDATAWSNTAGNSLYLVNRGTSDFFLAIAGNSLQIWATAIGGGSAAPSTTSWGATNIACAAGDTANNWLIIDASGNCHVSTDAADNWTQSGNGPIDAIAGFVPTDMDYESGTACVVGEDAANFRIARSSDNGANWTAATLYPSAPVAGAGVFRSVRALGNKCWVACGDTDATYNPDVWVSTDDGVTWYTPTLFVGLNNDLRHIWCDGSQIVLSGSSGYVVRSLRIGNPG